jgi:uncharacterized protein DUF4233
MSTGEGGGNPGVRSGLRDPARAVRGAGVACLAAQVLALLLAILPLRMLGALHLPVLLGLLALAVACLALAGALRHDWAWYAGLGPPALLVAGGLVVHPALSVLGAVFGLVWWYVLHVRRTVLR